MIRHSKPARLYCGPSLIKRIPANINIKVYPDITLMPNEYFIQDNRGNVIKRGKL